MTTCSTASAPRTPPPRTSSPASPTSRRSQPPKRRRRRWLAVPALGAIVAALVLLPSSAPQAKEIIQQLRAGAARRRRHPLRPLARRRSARPAARRTWSGSRQVWVRGDQQMRWLEDGGDEEVYAEGKGTTQRRPTASADRRRTCGWSRPRSSAPGAAGLEGRRSTSRRPTPDAYVLRWSENRYVKIDFTLWVDKETYAPLRFTDHSSGKDYKGKPFDQTYIEDDPRVQGPRGHAREPSVAGAQVALDRAGALAALGDRGDDQRLAAPRVAGGEHAVGGRVVGR